MTPTTPAARGGLGQQPGWLAKLGQQLGRLTAQSQLLGCLPWPRLRHGHCEQPQEHHDFMGEGQCPI
ncbi:hypothetical protein HaLaN_01026 [Haematococcus lacustris]|uniref:Uncharacterized protein n=1 Tax=Haematococcus lacustris TaxID=44745 RepID=A0A699YAP3_HAELA|nr:hypothetical protein HaLaN_01026 [Haematococcus lacustris]